MARRIDSLTPRTGRPAIYPWAKWADGSAWRIRRGEDFELPPSNMAAVIRSRAHRVGIAVATRVDGDCVEFQFSEPDKAAA